MGDALREAVEGGIYAHDTELQRLFVALAYRLRHARAKHDWTTTDTDYRAQFYALDVLNIELHELEEAVVNGEGRSREKDEALDVIAVAARYWLGDHLPEGEK